MKENKNFFAHLNHIPNKYFLIAGGISAKLHTNNKIIIIYECEDKEEKQYIHEIFKNLKPRYFNEDLIVNYDNNEPILYKNAALYLFEKNNKEDQFEIARIVHGSEKVATNWELLDKYTVLPYLSFE